MGLHTTLIDILHACAHTHSYIYSNIPSLTYHTLEYIQIHVYSQTLLLETLHVTSCHTYKSKIATSVYTWHTDKHCDSHHCSHHPCHTHSGTNSTPYVHCTVLMTRAQCPHTHRSQHGPKPMPHVPSLCCAWQSCSSGNLGHMPGAVGTVG